MPSALAQLPSPRSGGGDAAGLGRPAQGALSPRRALHTGYRHWHADLRPDDSPLEAGLAFACKLKAATPFLGREALEEQRAQGLRRRLVCFTVDE